MKHLNDREVELAAQYVVEQVKMLSDDWRIADILALEVMVNEVVNADCADIAPSSLFMVERIACANFRAEKFLMGCGYQR